MLRLKNSFNTIIINGHMQITVRLVIENNVYRGTWLFRRLMDEEGNRSCNTWNKNISIMDSKSFGIFCIHLSVNIKFTFYSSKTGNEALQWSSLWVFAKNRLLARSVLFGPIRCSDYSKSVFRSSVDPVFETRWWRWQPFSNVASPSLWETCGSRMIKNRWE